MPEVSQRGRIMPASPIRRLNPLANKAQERGIKVYRLNIGQPDVPTSPEGLEALKHIDRKVLEYSPSEGLLSLRKKLQQYYSRFNIDVDVDDIIVTTGGSEAVLFAFMACLDPGDEIIAGICQLYGFRNIGRCQDCNDTVVDRRWFRASSCREIRGTYHSAHQGHTHL